MLSAHSSATRVIPPSTAKCNSTSLPTKNVPHRLDIVDSLDRSCNAIRAGAPSVAATKHAPAKRCTSRQRYHRSYIGLRAKRSRILESIDRFIEHKITRSFSPSFFFGEPPTLARLLFLQIISFRERCLEKSHKMLPYLMHPPLPCSRGNRQDPVPSCLPPSWTHSGETKPRHPYSIRPPREGWIDFWGI